jgi:hypothetical protein
MISLGSVEAEGLDTSACNPYKIKYSIIYLMRIMDIGIGITAGDPGGLRRSRNAA